MVHINIITHDGRSYSFAIEGDEMTIGRDKDNDIVLSDPRISNSHAKIIKQKDGYSLTDLGSHNGTRVNEEFVQKTLLEHNDEIRIGQNRLTFLTKEETSPSIAKTLVMEMDSDYKKWHQRTMKINPKESCQKDSHSLLLSPESKKGLMKRVVSPISKKKSLERRVETESIPLERANKALFVLYEISRQLNSIHDFNELLEKIMDFIFMVIDADYGFLILTDDEKSDQFIPVVVKYKDEKRKSQGEIKASRTIINKVINERLPAR